jgi:signal transduction histidine kinase
MIKRIKRKYAIIIMSSVITVLGLIITSINLANYSSIGSLLDEKLTMLVENDGLIPEVNFGEPPAPPATPEEEEPKEPEDPTDPGAEPTDPGASETPGTTTNPEEGGEGTGTGGDTANGDAGGDTDPDNGGGSENTEEPSTDPDNEGGNGTGDGNGTDTDQDTDDNKDKDKDKTDKKEEGGSKKEDIYQSMSPETPFELRYFSVKLDTDGTLLDVYTEKIVAVNDSKAAQYAIDIFNSENAKVSGFVDTYRYMSGSTEDGNLIYVFLDANRELKSYKTFLLSSLVITAVGILIVFAVVILFSDTALRPIIESYEKQKRFITDAGHEMKTPLTIISANTEIMEMENGESQWSTGIKSQVSKLTDLTEKLVILSKMEEGAKLEMSEFSLSEAFFDTCDQYKSIAMSKGIRFETDISDNVNVIGNEGDIRRCITLLLDNAFRYVSDGGFVSISVKEVNGSAELRFSNSTNGVEKGSLDVWFDRFYRTDLSRNSATGGSGIGLSVVQAIVFAHGGSVHAYSNDGVNVEFVINI